MITVATTIQAPLETVWSCWTDPAHITQWNFASPEWHCPRASNDVRPGGQFSWRMEAKDGSMGFDFNGTYRDVAHSELLTYALEDGRHVRITFHQQGDAVQLEESFEAEGTHADEMQRAGWQAILENFKNYVESQ